MKWLIPGPRVRKDPNKPQGRWLCAHSSQFSGWVRRSQGLSLAKEEDTGASEKIMMLYGVLDGALEQK